MKAYEFLTESSNTNLLIIDVQPEYSSHSDYILAGVQNMIEAVTGGKIVIVFNDSGGGDDQHVVYNYLAGFNDFNADAEEYDEEREMWVHKRPKLVQNLTRATYLQKEYGFLRPFMDLGISDAVIIEILREMYQRKVTDSREMELTSMSERVQTEIEQSSAYWDEEGIAIQSWVPVTLLKQISPFYMMGGGRNECLREIELICNAFNIKYKRVDSLIY